MGEDAVSDVICLTPKCYHNAASPAYRGLCLVCYGKAKKLVAEKKTTWEELEQMGLALPTGGDPFADAFDSAKGKHASDSE